MKLWKKALIPVVALAVMIPAGAFAEEQSSASTTPDQAQTQDAGPNMPGRFMEGKGFHHMKAREWFGDGVNREMYMELLAEKYAPDTLDQWKAAIAERNQLKEQIKALRPSEEELQERREEMKAKRTELQEKLKSGEITKEEMKTQLQEWAKSWKGQSEVNKEDMQAAIEARKQLREQFNQAIESRDADKIKAALSAELDQWVKDNQALAAKLQELQAKAQQ